MSSSNDLTEKMAALTEVWWGEHVEVKLDFDDKEWCVSLVWVSEYDNPHHADWVEYTWQFYGDSAYGAAKAALDWAKGLLPFKRCEACGGEGCYNTREAPGEPLIATPCDECDGTGLANPSLKAEKVSDDNC